MSQVLEDRFSRANVLALIANRMRVLEETYGWQEGHGRVVLGDNPERDKVLDFGTYECLCHLYEDLSE